MLYSISIDKIAGKRKHKQAGILVQRMYSETANAVFLKSSACRIE